MNENTLYPVFLKLRNLRVLIVGGGYVAEEKLHFLLKSSPDAHVTLVAPMFRDGTLTEAKKGDTSLIQRPFDPADVNSHSIVIAATNDPDLNERIYHLCRAQDKLVNVADNPLLCDFYLGGIVTKGHVKIAISTNGQSPTTAKRLRQFFEDILPDDISEMVANLNRYRTTLRGNFEEKVTHMNRLTRKLVER